MSLIGIIIAVILLCLLFWAVQYLMAAFNLPPQIRAVIIVLLVVLAVVWVIGQIGYGASPFPVHLGR